MLDIYIVCHNKESFEYFKDLNKDIYKQCIYVLVGDYKSKPEWMSENVIIPNTLKYNIEEHKTLLTFTAWYALVKNNLLKSDYIGVFEYDCKLDGNIYSLNENMSKNALIGFVSRNLPDKLFMTFIPEFNDMLSEEQKSIVDKQDSWYPTTNFIMTKEFISSFVYWYETFIPQILKINNHPHIHERAINIYGFKDYSFISKPEYMKHYYMQSHNIKLR